MLKVPVVLFVYNRPEHTQKTLEALKKNNFAMETELFIYSDAAKNEQALSKVSKVRKIIRSVSGFKNVKIIEADRNKGLANSIIQGVSEVISIYKKVIVLEDDLITSEFFLEFMNNALEFYENDDRIWSISGYSLPIEIPEYYLDDVYLAKRSWSWGWATWENRWNQVEWDLEKYQQFKNDKKLQKEFNKSGGDDLSLMLLMQMNGKVDSWYVRWQYTQFLLKKYCIYSQKTLIENIGLDGTGTHSKEATTKYLTNLNQNDNDFKFKKDIECDKLILKRYKHYNTSYRLKLINLLIKIGIYDYIKKVRK